MSRGRSVLGAAGLFAAACSGLSSTLAKDLPVPHTLAVLPCQGDTTPQTRELARALLGARLAERGYRLVENAYVDRVLAENGWLGDPDRFDASRLPMAAALQRLGVDGMLLADEFDESSFNILLLRRHALTGRARIVVAGGQQWWTARNKVGTTGGLLLQSGQVLTELRAQGMHGTSSATIGLLDALLEDVAGTLPNDDRRDAAPATGQPLQLAEAEARPAANGADGAQRLQVAVRAAPAATLTFDVGPVQGMPMAGNAGQYRGAVDLPDGGSGTAVRIRARDPFGQEQQVEVRR